MKSHFQIRFCVIVSASIFLITGVNRAFSEESLPQTGKTENTWEALLADVSANNPELKFYEAEVLAAKGLRKTAGLWSNPQVSGFVGQKKVTGSANDESATAKGAAYKMAITQSIEWPGRISLRKAIADRDIQAAELGLEQFRALLAKRTKTAIYDLIVAQEKSEATREVADHFHDLNDVLTQRDQAGLALVLEARIIEAMELNSHRKAHEAVVEYQTALFDLNQLRGAPLEKIVSLSQRDLKFKPLEKNKNELIAFAHKNDFQVRMRGVELERQKDGVSLAKNERFPAITAGPAISQERAGERERMIGAEVSLPMPLWDRNQGAIQTAKAQQSLAQTKFDLAEQEVARRVIAAATIYEAKLEEMSHWKPDLIQHFKEAAELADRHYRLGAVPVSTYIELQFQYLETIEGVQHTQKEALEAAAQLELMTGIDLFLIEIGSGENL